MMTDSQSNSPYRSVNKQSKAFSLIELAIILGIVGLVVGGIWIGASAVIEKRRINETIQAIGVISDGVGRLYTNSAIEGAANGTSIVSVLIDAKIPPADWVVGSQIVDPWGNAVVIRSTGADVSSPLPRIYIELQNLTVSRCMQILPKLPSKNLLGVWVPSPSSVFYTTFPLDPNGPICSTTQSRFSINYSVDKN